MPEWEAGANPQRGPLRLSPSLWPQFPCLREGLELKLPRAFCSPSPGADPREPQAQGRGEPRRRLLARARCTVRPGGARRWGVEARVGASRALLASGLSRAAAPCLQRVKEQPAGER